MWATQEKVDGFSDVTKILIENGGLIDYLRFSSERCRVVMQLNTSKTGTRGSFCDTHTKKSHSLHFHVDLRVEMLQRLLLSC